MSSKNTSTIGLLALVLLISGAIDSVRNLPATALFGSELIFFFIISAIIFLIPVAFVSAELSAMWSDDGGGVYSWVRHAFGEKWAFFTIWLQWINTMVWYPSIISFFAGTAAYFINPELASHKGYIVSVIIVVFWGMTWVTLRGVQSSARFAGFCAIFGMLVPMAVIIGLGVVWMCQGKPLQVDFSWGSLMPHFGNNASWISLTAIMTSFLGMELASVHVNQVKDPRKTFPKAIFYSVFLILVTMILGSLAIAVVMPQKDINLVAGVMQAFTHFFAVYHLEWLVPVLTAMLLIGSLGGMINWIISPVQGLLKAAEHGFMPPFLTKRNEHGVPSRLLMMQAILVTVLCSAFLLIPSVNGIYWLLTALSTQLYMLMYVMMFLAAMYIKKQYANHERPFAVPGGKVGYYITCLLGLFGCAVTLTVGFIPPEMLDIGSVLRYESIFCSGFIGLLLPSVFFYAYRRRQK